MSFLRLSVLLLVFATLTRLHGIEAGPDDVLVRIVDVGPGLCCVAKMPGKHYLVYDTGDKAQLKYTLKGLKDMIPAQEPIDLMVLSHTDSDHIGGVPAICTAYTVKTILRPGMPAKEKGVWPAAVEAITEECKTEKCEDISVTDGEVKPGPFKFGEATVTFIFGMSQPPADWHLSKSSGEWKNAGSIVVRLEYKHRSVLFCGDIVGRQKGKPTDNCIASEKLIVTNTKGSDLDSDVMIAPHHGGDNGSSMPFIQAVHPQYVIFAAGHKHSHPTQAAAERYITCGLTPDRMLRTDFGDDEGALEWTYGRLDGQRNAPGDQDIDIVITANGDLKVEYRKEKQK